MMTSVCWLQPWHQTVCIEVGDETCGNHSLRQLWHECQVGHWSIVFQLIWVQSGLLKQRRDDGMLVWWRQSSLGAGRVTSLSRMDLKHILWEHPPGMLVLVRVLVLKDSLRTNFKSMSLSLKVCPCSIVLEKSLLFQFSLRVRTSHSICFKHNQALWGICRGVRSKIASRQNPQYSHSRTVALKILLLKEKFADHLCIDKYTGITFPQQDGLWYVCEYTAEMRTGLCSIDFWIILCVPWSPCNKEHLKPRHNVLRWWRWRWRQVEGVGCTHEGKNDESRIKACS